MAGFNVREFEVSYWSYVIDFLNGVQAYGLSVKIV